jgi:hypothetical protein
MLDLSWLSSPSPRERPTLHELLENGDLGRAATFLDFYIQAQVAAAWRGDVGEVLRNEANAAEARQYLQHLWENEGLTPEKARDWIDQLQSDLRREAQTYMEARNVADA